VLRYGVQDWADVDVTDDGIADYRAIINPWNMNSATGNVYLSSNNTVKIFSDLTNIQPAHPTNGYPKIYVGRKKLGIESLSDVSLSMLCRSPIYKV